MIWLLIICCLRPQALVRDLELANALLAPHKETLMVRWCLYCNTFIEVIDGKGVKGITHGACNSCFQRKVRRMVDEGA